VLRHQFLRRNFSKSNRKKGFSDANEKNIILDPKKKKDFFSFSYEIFLKNRVGMKTLFQVILTVFTMLWSNGFGVHIERFWREYVHVKKVKLLKVAPLCLESKIAQNCSFSMTKGRKKAPKVRRSGHSGIITSEAQKAIAITAASYGSSAREINKILDVYHGTINRIIDKYEAIYSLDRIEDFIL
jgi:hypothetical protein